MEDEEVIDHLLAVFEPKDATGTDGKVHMEMAYLVCSCGFQAFHGDDLDYHFLVVFTPSDQVGKDGLLHEPIAPVIA
ncbi:MAG TPA: hypothetical protein VMG38_00535 [Trebonia sp.]|nr:hypothetical protein [Trebonia sp.]